VAVIVHPQSPDSLFTMDEIRAILTGKFSKKLIPVFDGVQATSTVRFIVDSILRSDSLSPQTMAARTSEGVIDYVANHPEAIGFIGVSWIGNRDDSQQVSFLKKVKIAQLESKNLPGKYILPVQANIYLNRYPMVRDLVYMLKERHKGLGHGFADFMSGEIGQLIFKRAYLMPTQRKFLIRPIRVNE
jgi:phosphate transport system substrate-binding protein